MSYEAVPYLEAIKDPRFAKRTYYYVSHSSNKDSEVVFGIYGRSKMVKFPKEVYDELGKFEPSYIINGYEILEVLQRLQLIKV